MSVTEPPRGFAVKSRDMNFSASHSKKGGKEHFEFFVSRCSHSCPGHAGPEFPKGAVIGYHNKRRPFETRTGTKEGLLYSKKGGKEHFEFFVSRCSHSCPEHAGPEFPKGAVIGYHNKRRPFETRSRTKEGLLY
jgi:hypothetical protein